MSRNIKVILLAVAVFLVGLLIYDFVTDISEYSEANANEVQVPFDPDLWKTKENGDYPHRNSMIADVVFHPDVRQANKTELIEILGRPDRENEGHLYYRISQKKMGHWILHAKSMVVKLTQEGAVEWIKIHE